MSTKLLSIVILLAAIVHQGIASVPGRPFGFTLFANGLDPTYTAAVCQAVRKLGITDEAKDVKARVQKRAWGPEHGEIYSTLSVALHEPRGQNDICSEKVVSLLKSILACGWWTEPERAALRELLWPNMGECYARVTLPILLQDERKLLAEFDEFFSRTLDPERAKTVSIVNDQQFLAYVSNFDWASSPMQLTGLHFKSDEPLAEGTTFSDLFQRFVNGLCGNIGSLQHKMDIIGLFSELDPKPDDDLFASTRGNSGVVNKRPPPHWKRMLSYQRICLSWRRPESRSNFLNRLGQN
jgi:hypothetical protein